MEYILNLDLLSFNELIVTVTKNKYRERIQLAWENFAASQCASQKDFKKAIIAPYEKIVGSDTGRNDDSRAFMQKFRGGM